MAIVINSNPTATTASNNLSKANEALREVWPGSLRETVSLVRKMMQVVWLWHTS